MNSSANHNSSDAFTTLLFSIVVLGAAILVLMMVL